MMVRVSYLLLHVRFACDTPLLLRECFFLEGQGRLVCVALCPAGLFIFLVRAIGLIRVPLSSLPVSPFRYDECHSVLALSQAS